MLILNSFIYKTIMKISSRHYCCSTVWNNEDSNAFSVKLLDIYILNVHILEKY